MTEKETGELLQKLKRIDQQKELESFVKTYVQPDPYETVCQYLQDKLAEKGLSRKDVVRASGIYRTYAYQILQGTRQPSRDKLIALCMGMGLSLEETQRALLIAGAGILYAKRGRDAILIFSINKKLGVLEANALLFDMGEAILE